MEPLKRFIFGQESVQEVEELPAQKNVILADKIQDVLGGVDLWEAEVMGADLAESLEDEMLQDAFWTLLNVFLEYKENPTDPSKFEGLRRAGDQCQRLMGEGASEAMESVLEALTLRYEPVWKEVEGELQQVEIDRSKFKPRSEQERYYKNEGFHQLPRSPSVWTHVDIGMDEGVFSIEMKLAFPGKKEFTTKMEFPWSVPDHPPPSLGTIGRAMAEVMQGEEVEGPLGRVAAEWVAQLKERVIELVQVSHAQEAVASETVHDAMEQRVHDLKEESLQLLMYFDRFSAKIGDSIPLREETEQMLDSLKGRIEKESNIETLIFIQNMLRVVIPTAVDIQSKFVGGNPITYEDQEVLRAIAEVAGLQELLEAPDDELIALTLNLSNGLIMSAALHPAAAAAFEAGMDPRDVLKFSDKLQHRESTINQLMMAVAKARKEAPRVADYRVFQTEQMAKINALRDRITIEEDLIRDGGLDEILVKIDRIISDVKTEAESFDETLHRFGQLVPLSDNTVRLMKKYSAQSPTLRLAFIRHMNFMLEQHDKILESLGRDEPFSLDLIKMAEENSEFQASVIDALVPFTAQEEAMKLLQIWSRDITGYLIFDNFQLFSDTARINGLDIQTFTEHYGKLGGKLHRFYVGSVPKYAKEISDEKGVFSRWGSQPDEERMTFLVKSDWTPIDLSEDEEGNPYFREGYVTLGRTLWFPESETWGDVHETRVPLDLTVLEMMDSRVKTEEYFNLLSEMLLVSSAGDLYDRIKEEATKDSSQTNELFTDDEIREIADHMYEFITRVRTGLYKVHYADRPPEETKKMFPEPL